jgi:hypothetical protein
MFKRTRYQFGNLEVKRRRKGPDVWVYRHRTPKAGGRRKQASVMIGTVEQYPTKAQAGGLRNRYGCQQILTSRKQLK